MGKWSNVKVPHLACKVCEYGARFHWKCNVPHVACKGVSTVFVLIENAMYRTLLAQRKCWLIDNYFKEYKHLKTAEPHVASNVRYISFQRNLQLKIHLSSYPKW